MMFLIYNAVPKITVGAVDRDGAEWVSVEGRDVLKGIIELRTTDLGKKKPTDIVLCNPSEKSAEEEKPTWSQVRAATVIANTLAFAYGAKVHLLERYKSLNQTDFVEHAVELVNGKQGSNLDQQWLRPKYDGEPNITN